MATWLKAVLGALAIAGVLAAVGYFFYEKAREVRAVTAAAASPDFRLVATAHGMGFGKPKCIYVWDAATGRIVRTVEIESSMMVLSWSPDGKLLASGNYDGDIFVWDAAEWRRLATLDGGNGYVEHIAWSPDGTRIAAGDDSGIVRVWEATSGQTFGVYHVHSGNVAEVVWSPDGRMIASAGWDGAVKVIAATTGTPLLQDLDTTFVASVAWSPDSALLAAGGLSNLVRIYDVANAKRLFELTSHKGPVRDLAWAPAASRLLASAGDDDVLRIWDGATGEQLRAVDLHDTSDPNVVWSPDGARAACGSLRDVYVCAVSAGAPAYLPCGDGYRVAVLAWSPDGTRLAALNYWEDEVTVWDVAGETRIAELRMSLFDGIRRAFL